MSERRAGTKGRRLGSSRRRQIREGSSEVPAPGPGEEQPSEIVQRVQDFLREQDKDQAGFITRSDIQRFQEEGFPCSTEELELVFDGLDAAGSGRLSTEEFTAGLRQFLSSQKAAREHRRRKTASRRVQLVLPSPALEGVDSEERRHFAAFMDQLGTDNVSEEQEIWQLWVKLRQDEPQLLGNLEDFLAKMRQRIQEAKSKKEALEVTLNKRVAEHDKEVQQLCEVLEQQIQQEQQRLEQKSMARSHQQGAELQRVLDASEREVQRLVTAQMELERRCRSLRSTQQVTSTENRELEASNRMLEDHLQHLHQQLKQTQGHLRTMRATVAWEHVEEPGDRAVAELPSEMPMSPQMSPGKSEKFRSEMRIRLGSQSEERKAKNTHQVVWEMLPAEISISGAPPRVSSAEEEPFPEHLKEEHFSDQSSLLREMNDAIAALSKHLKAQAPGAPPALADTASHPQDDAEPQAEQEAATAHGTTPGVLQDTLPGHVSHELFEGDLKEGPATAEFRALDVTQAGASVGAGHHMAQEPGAEQGESPEEAQRMIFLQGKGAGVKEMVLKVTEHLGESKEAGEQAVMEVEGAGWMQENTGWEKAQLLGEAEEAGIRQGESLEAGLGLPEAGQAGLAEEVQPGAAPGERAQALGMALQERAHPSLGLSEKLEIELGEHLEPEPPSRGEAQVGAAQGDVVTPEVTAAPGPGVQEEEEQERVRAELQPQGEPSGAEVLPAPAGHGMSRRAGGEEEEVEETQPREAELQLQGGSVRGDAGRGGSAGAEVPLAAAVPPPDVREGGVGADVEPLEAQNSDTDTMQVLAEVEAGLQVSSEAGSPGTEQGGSVDPAVQPLEEEDEPQLGLGEERGAAEVPSEGPSFTETPAGSSGLCELFPVRSQAWELVEAEDAQVDVQLRGGLSPETLWGGKGGTDIQLEEEEGGAQGQGECELPQEPVLEPHGAAVGKAEGVGAGVQPQEAESLDTLEDQNTAGNVQLLTEVDELKLTPGGSTEADLQLLGEAGSTGTEQGGRLDPDVQPLDQVNKAEFLEMEAEDAQVDVQLRGGLSPGAPWGGEGGTAIQLEEEGGAQGQGECELPQEPGLDPQGAAVGQGEEAGAGVQLWEGAASLDTSENQSTAGNVLLTEVDKLESAPGRSTESDLQPLSETDSLGSEQGGSVDPGVQPLDQVNTVELVEMVETEESWSDKQLSGDASPEKLQEEGHHAAMELGDEAEDWGQGQGERGLPQEPVLDTLEHQGTGDNVQLLTEVDELRLTPGGSTEADLQLLSEAGSTGTEQGGSLDPDVQSLDQVDEQELVEMEAEGAQTDTQLGGGLSPGAPWGGEGEKAVQLEQEEEDRGQGQGECELPLEPVLDVQGAAVGQGEGAGEDMQSQEEAESLDTLKDQSSDATVQSLAEEEELKVTPGGSTEAGLQLLGEAGSTGTEQGGSTDPGVQPLDQVDGQGILETEAEDAQVDVQLRGGLSPGAPWGGEGGTAIQLEEEGGAQGQGECELPQEPGLDPQGAAVGQGEEAGAGVQLWEGAASLDTSENQSTAGNVLLTEVDKLESAPGRSTESDLQPLSETDSLGSEQGGSVDPGVQPLDQVNTVELVEMVETEESWSDKQLSGDASPEKPQEEGHHAAMELGDEAEDWGQGQGERGLPQEPVLDTLEHQGTGDNVQLLTEVDELRLTPGGSTEADLQLLGEAGSTGTEQGGSLDPDVQSLDQVDEQELVEMEAEGAQTDTQLGGGLSPGAPWGGEGEKAVQLEQEEEDGGQGQGECELPLEPVLDVQGAAVGQGEGAGEDMQSQEEAESLDTLKDQSTDATVQSLAEEEELKVTPGGSTEAGLQLLGEAGSTGTEQGGSTDPGVQPLDQVDGQGILETEAEDAQVDVQLRGGLSPGAPWGGEGGTAIQLEEGGAQGQGECELPQEPVLDPQGAAVGQGEEAGAGVQLWEGAASLDTSENQSTAGNVQLLTEVDKLESAPGRSTESDLQPLSKTDSLGSEQGGSVDPGVQPLDQVDKAELVEMETQDSWTDMQLFGRASPETPQGKGDNAAVQLRDEAEDGGQGQGELVLDPQGARARQGEGVGAGAQLREEAESLDTLEGQSTGANMQLLTEEDELKLTPGGSAETGVAPLGAAGMWEGEQSLTPGVGAGLCAAHITDTWQGAAAAHVPPPAEADSYPGPVTAAEGLGLEAKLGAPTGPDGHILGDTQALELPQGERAAAEGRPLDGAQGLEVVQGERLEAGVRNVVETQGLGRSQGHDDGVSAPASPVSEVPSQTGTVELERMMQEDVLIPDVWRVCASGQAAQSELQEQVSAQGHQVRIPTPAQRPEGKTPRVVEPEQAAAGPAEPPKQEVPPVSTPQLRVQPQEDAGNDQLGMVLTDSSLGDAANSCVQPQRQLLGEQSEDLRAGQREKPQQFGQKTSQEGEPSPGEPEAVTAEGAGAAPKGCPKAPLDPDHLYNVLFVGDSHVGKTSFLYRLHADSFNPNLTATVGLDYRIKNLVVDNKRFALRLWDSAGQERYHSMTKQFFRKADGVVLMYDITSQYSFSDVRYWLSCIQEAAEDGVAVLLLGNKTDCAAERQVPVKEGECLAKEHQLMFYECSAASGHNVLESMVSFIRLLKVREDELKKKAEEVPKAPQKKKNCCW